MKYLSAAIVFATIVGSVMFRYEYQGPNGLDRVNRWTGTMETMCFYVKPAEWLPVGECQDKLGAK